MAYKWLLKIRSKAQQTFDILSTGEKRVIFRQLRELLNSDDPYRMAFVEMLQAERFERIRKFRAGNYRVFFVVKAVEVTHIGHTYKGTLYLLDIRDRK